MSLHDCILCRPTEATADAQKHENACVKVLAPPVYESVGPTDWRRERGLSDRIVIPGSRRTIGRIGSARRRFLLRIDKPIQRLRIDCRRQCINKHVGAAMNPRVLLRLSSYVLAHAISSNRSHHAVRQWAQARCHDTASKGAAQKASRIEFISVGESQVSIAPTHRIRSSSETPYRLG
jgi:hypothetical protein